MKFSISVTSNNERRIANLYVAIGEFDGPVWRKTAICDKKTGEINFPTEWHYAPNEFTCFAVPRVNPTPAVQEIFEQQRKKMHSMVAIRNRRRHDS